MSYSRHDKPDCDKNRIAKRLVVSLSAVIVAGILSGCLIVTNDLPRIDKLPKTDTAAGAMKPSVLFQLDAYGLGKATELIRQDLKSLATQAGVLDKVDLASIRENHTDYDYMVFIDKPKKNNEGFLCVISAHFLFAVPCYNWEDHELVAEVKNRSGIITGIYRVAWTNQIWFGGLLTLPLLPASIYVFNSFGYSTEVQDRRLECYSKNSSMNGRFVITLNE